MEGFTAAVDRHGVVTASGWRGGAGAAVQAVRALRRRELFRIACADLLGTMPGGVAPAGPPLDVQGVGQALADVTDATLGAALRAAQSRVRAQGMRFAIIGMGRYGGAELSYSSDADVLFVYEPPPGIAEDTASGTAHQIAEELRRLLSAPSPEPPLGIDADLRPEGRQGPLVRSLAAYERYYAEWSKIWEAQALLRARFVAGDESLGRAVPDPGRPRPLPRERADRRAGHRDPPDQGAGRHRAAAPRRRPGHPREARPGRAGRRGVGRPAAPAPARAPRCRRCGPRARSTLWPPPRTPALCPQWTPSSCPGAG